jgi:ATP-dependent DNA helicase RecG
MDLETPIGQLYMVGPIYAKRLAKLKINTIEDLLYHFPFRYDDFSLISEIGKIHAGEIVTVKAKIESLKNEFTKNGKKIQKAQVLDQTGKLEIIWFNQMYLVKTLIIGETYNFSGKVDWFGRTLAMISPDYEQIKQPTTNNSQPTTIHTGRLVPVYPETYGVSSKWLRSRIVPQLFNEQIEIIDYMPGNIMTANQLVDLEKALKQIHFPANLQESEQAKIRLAFDELFLIQLAVQIRKLEWQKTVVSHQFSLNQEKILDFTSKLPFTLTNAQNRCIKEILGDLEKSQPMNRLLEGDVGSGKTVVAAIAVYVAYLNGFQSVLMAPTEILANQHYQTLTKLLTPFGLKIDLITGSSKPSTHNKQLTTNVYVGTHALIQKGIEFEKLGLVVIDEQHRFGVGQRGLLVKKGKSPHVLTMTATPIPRTIALTIYGDLDLSIIDELPVGRQRVKTWVVPKIKREAAYNWIRDHVKGTSEQAFIVCPLIEESETLSTVKSVKAEYEKLSHKIFPDLKLGLLHGRLKPKEKEEVIKKFREGELDILVSTPVVEVGIDIPQATIMLIEAADRFGLAGLHQLRGRVGRGQKQSYCLLFTEFDSGLPFERLKSMENIYIGSELSEIDLKMRGPGEVYGKAQHGFVDLKLASFTDYDLISKTRKAALETVTEIEKFPLLKERLKKDIIKDINLS